MEEIIPQKNDKPIPGQTCAFIMIPHNFLFILSEVHSSAQQ